MADDPAWLRNGDSRCVRYPGACSWRGGRGRDIPTGLMPWRFRSDAPRGPCWDGSIRHAARPGGAPRRATARDPACGRTGASQTLMSCCWRRRCARKRRCVSMTSQQALLKASRIIWRPGCVKRVGRAMRNDPAAVERAFEHALKRSRNDSHDGSALQALVWKRMAACRCPRRARAMCKSGHAGATTGMDHDSASLDQALLIASTSRIGTLPAYNNIQPDHCCRCRVSRWQAATRAGCRNFLTRMADGDVCDRATHGTGQLVATRGRHDPDASLWRERYRGDRWIIAQLADRDVQRLLNPEDMCSTKRAPHRRRLRCRGPLATTRRLATA